MKSDDLNPVLSLLNELKRKKKIPWAKLGRGLCPGELVADIATGGREAPLYFLEILIQRLGASLDNFELLVSYMDYDDVMLRDEIEDDIFGGKKGEADTKLDSLDLSKSYNLMFYYRMKALEAFLIDQNLEECKNMLLEATKISLDGTDTSEIRNLLLSETETENLLALQKIRFLLGENKTAIFEELVRYYEYIEAHFDEEEERAKLIAKCTWLMMKILNEDKCFEESAHYGIKAIDLLGKWNQYYFMEPLLEQMGRAYEGLGVPKESNVWLLSLETFLECEKVIGYDEQRKDIILRNFSLKELILDSDVVSRYRKSIHMSQEELATGIFSSAKPISDFERGKSVMSRKNLIKVLEKLGIEKSLGDSFYHYSSYELQKKKVNLNLLYSKSQYKRVADILETMAETNDSKLIDEDWDFKFFREIIDVENGRSDIASLLDKEKEYLREFIDIGNRDVHRVPFKLDSVIVNNYLNNLLKMNPEEFSKKEESLLRMMKIIEKCKGAGKYRYRTYGAFVDRHLYFSHQKELMRKAFFLDVSHGKACGFLTEMYIAIQYFDGLEDHINKVLFSKALLFCSYLYFFMDTYEAYYSYLVKDLNEPVPHFARNPNRLYRDWEQTLKNRD